MMTSRRQRQCNHCEYWHWLLLPSLHL